ncbi:MAG: hypothetical protein LC679_17500 [Intrasporangiaceae bacterium]|nr:hypothetical protein [Intrasporangiaceae bacterium]
MSYVAGRIHDQLKEIGGEQVFAQRLTSLEPVRGVRVTLPFTEGLPTDWGFWKSIAESDLATPLPEGLARHCRRANVPLRCSGRLDAPSAVNPRLEAHLHRFGVVAVATMDLEWPEPLSLEHASRQVQSLEGQAARVHVGGREVASRVASAAADAASSLVAVLTDGTGRHWDLPRHRLTTVIDGAGAGPATDVMPGQGSPLHVMLHHLAGGGEAVAKPSTAFVAQFTNAGYGFPAARMVYMLNTGTSALLRAAWSPEHRQPPTASDWHRERTLLTAYVSALSGLVAASSQSDNVMFPAWAEPAAKMLARLYGPGRGYLDWGRFPAELLHRTGAASEVARILGSQLTYNADYPADAYEVMTPPQ